MLINYDENWSKLEFIAKSGECMFVKIINPQKSCYFIASNVHYYESDKHPGQKIWLINKARGKYHTEDFKDAFNEFKRQTCDTPENNPYVVIKTQEGYIENILREKKVMHPEHSADYIKEEIIKISFSNQIEKARIMRKYEAKELMRLLIFKKYVEKEGINYDFEIKTMESEIQNYQKNQEKTLSSTKKPKPRLVPKSKEITGKGFSR